MWIKNIKSHKMLGFSLAEVLVSLTIIGVIAAMTVPTMITKYQRRTQLLSLHKMFSEFTQVMGLFAINDNIGTHVYRSSLSLKGRASTDAVIATTSGRFLRNYFQIISDCKTNTTPCFADSYENLSNVAQAFTCNKGYSVTLASGSAVCIIPANTSSPAKVYVDTNGAIEPNIGGRDMFNFEILDDGYIGESTSTTCGTVATGDGCFKKIMNENWKMNY